MHVCAYLCVLYVQDSAQEYCSGSQILDITNTFEYIFIASNLPMVLVQIVSTGYLCNVCICDLICKKSPC